MNKSKFLWLLLAMNGTINGVGDKSIMGFLAGLTGESKLGLYMALLITVIIRVCCFFSAYKIFNSQIINKKGK